jgi:membrane-bound lytic murein transglycosylase A
LGAATIERPHARWVAVRWSDLPGWEGDRVGEFWTAFLRSCERPAPAWLDACTKARQGGTRMRGEGAMRDWMQQQLRPYRIESLERDPVGLATGYFEPLVEASRVARPGFRFALYAPPADLATRSPYWTRKQLETLPAAQKSLRGNEIAWLRDRLDALLLQVQGSGRLVFVDDPRRPATVVRVAYAAHNDQPYRSVARWLIEQGELRASDASWPAIRAWARPEPGARRRDAAQQSGASSSSAKNRCPIQRSAREARRACRFRPAALIAVDRRASRTERRSGDSDCTTEAAGDAPAAPPGGHAGHPIGDRRRGPRRLLWGWGDEAEAAAGRMEQPLRMWALWPAS